MKWRRGTGSDEDATKVPGQETVDTSTDGKGRATPTRKQVEAERKERLRASARGESVGRSRSSSSTSKAERADVRKRALAGDERVLSARDRGPERKYARDLVDARRTVGEYFLYLALLVLVVGLIRVKAFAIGSQVLLALIVLALVVDSVRIRGQVTRAVAEKFPNGNLDGVGRYAVTRAMVTRRMRVPAPQVKRGR